MRPLCIAINLLALSACTSTPVANNPPPPRITLPSGTVVEAGPAYLCENYEEVMRDVQYPQGALALNIKKGTAMVQFTLTEAGRVENIRTLQSSHAVFGTASAEIVARFRCRAQGNKMDVKVPFAYQLVE